MNILHEIKPNLQTGFLNYGKGQEITYLAVPEFIGLKELNEDINNGASQFKELAEFAKKKPSRFVVINCQNKEEGLLATAYLSSIYNKQDKLDPDDYDEDTMYEDMDIEFEDFEEDPLGLSDYDNDEDEDNWEEECEWIENPWKIPVVSAQELMVANDNSIYPFHNGGYSSGGIANPRNRLPYWYYTRQENICVVYDANNQLGAIWGLAEKLKRYKNNRHVFIVAVSAANSPFGLSFDTDDNYMDPVQTCMCEVILEYSASAIDIATEESERAKYYDIVFENWIQRYNFTLEKRFPVHKITQSIVAMNNTDKSSLMEKIIRYVDKDERSTRELTEADFAILEKFRKLGAVVDSKKNKSAAKLRDELVGMDEVKDQINGVVEIMRYNKRRKKMGLPTSNFHNVHMMLGAPGTAKTTVAELLGNMMAEEKLLPGNRFISVNGAELKGMYVGHSAPKVKALFDNYDIILIDEAYAVAAGSDGDNDSFSQEAIAQLIIELEKHGMDKLVIFAGYGGAHVSEKDNKMKSFLNANPGIRSRINSTIFFDSYTPEEMLEIFKCHAKIGGFNLDKKSDQRVRDFFEERVSRRDFGNGREARSLLENCTVEAAKRLADIEEDKLTEKMMREIKSVDIEKAIARMKSGLDSQLGREGLKAGFAC